MAFEDQLRAGIEGVHVPVPAEPEILSQGAQHLRWVDRELGLVMLAMHSPFPIDLSEARRAGLREELEREARRLFEQTYEELAREREAEDGDELPPSERGPRTADPSWSPIVEAGLIEHQGATVLRYLGRLSYQPGHELTCGQLTIPLARGHLFIQLMHRSPLTGMRESVLMHPLLAESQGPPFQHPGQAYFDDPKHDDKFPQHGLSCVRKGLAALLADEGGIEIRMPPALPGQGARITLPESQSSIIPPPGFVYVSREVLPMAPTLSSLVRLVLEPGPEAMLDVWRTDELARDAERLRVIAKRTAQDWAKEGAQEVRENTRISSAGPYAIAVQSEIDFVVQGSPRRNLCRWFVAEGGSVIRIGLSFPGTTPFADWSETLDALVESWESLLSEAETSDTSERKPWWRRLFSSD